jgi:hypothetical protein
MPPVQLAPCSAITSQDGYVQVRGVQTIDIAVVLPTEPAARFRLLGQFARSEPYGRCYTTEYHVANIWFRSPFNAVYSASQSGSEAVARGSTAYTLIYVVLFFYLWPPFAVLEQIYLQHQLGSVLNIELTSDLEAIHPSREPADRRMHDNKPLSRADSSVPRST